MDEITCYTDGTVTVTSKRLLLGDRSYSMSDVRYAGVVGVVGRSLFRLGIIDALKNEKLKNTLRVSLIVVAFVVLFFIFRAIMEAVSISSTNSPYFSLFSSLMGLFLARSCSGQMARGQR